MADVPGGHHAAHLQDNDSGATLGPFPLVAVRNVFVLPGEGEGLLCSLLDYCRSVLKVNCV